MIASRHHASCPFANLPPADDAEKVCEACTCRAQGGIVRPDPTITFGDGAHETLIPHLDRSRWVQVGDRLDAGPFWYSDRERWRSWSDEVNEQIEVRGAWFLVGWNPALDEIVIDVLGAYSRHPELLRSNNIRSIEFWRGWS